MFDQLEFPACGDPEGDLPDGQGNGEDGSKAVGGGVVSWICGGRISDQIVNFLKQERDD